MNTVEGVFLVSCPTVPLHSLIPYENGYHEKGNPDYRCGKCICIPLFFSKEIRCRINTNKREWQHPCKDKTNDLIININRIATVVPDIVHHWHDGCFRIRPEPNACYRYEYGCISKGPSYCKNDEKNRVIPRKLQIQ